MYAHYTRINIYIKENLSKLATQLLSAAWLNRLFMAHLDRTALF